MNELTIAACRCATYKNCVNRQKEVRCYWIQYLRRVESRAPTWQTRPTQQFPPQTRAHHRRRWRLCTWWVRHTICILLNNSCRKFYARLIHRPVRNFCLMVEGPLHKEAFCIGAQYNYIGKLSEIIGLRCSCSRLVCKVAYAQ